MTRNKKLGKELLKLVFHSPHFHMHYSWSLMKIGNHAEDTNDVLSRVQSVVLLPELSNTLILAKYKM